MTPCPDTPAISLGEGQRFAAYVLELVKSVELSGYLQSQKRRAGKSVELSDYLQSHRYLASPPLFQLKCMDWARAWVQQQGIMVGVHVRRQDYLTDANHVGRTQPLDFYAPALQRLRVQG
jgi:hypothetical protein